MASLRSGHTSLRSYAPFTSIDRKFLRCCGPAGLIIGSTMMSDENGMIGSRYCRMSLRGSSELEELEKFVQSSHSISSQ